MSRFLIRDIHDPIVYDAWDVNDDSLEVIDINSVVAHLPKAEPRMQLEDGFVIFMQEAYRCLAPGGRLTIRAPLASNPSSVADPLAQRYFNEGTFLHFAKPVDKEERDWKWGKYGKDHGTRFNIVHLAEDGGFIVCVMEKIGD